MTLLQFNVRSIDAIVLTHEHADAVLGLDDIRDFQKYRIYADPVTGVSGWGVVPNCAAVMTGAVHEVVGSIELHGSKYTLDRARLIYPYMLNSIAASTNQTTQPTRWRHDACHHQIIMWQGRYVGKLDCLVFDDESSPDANVP